MAGTQNFAVQVRQFASDTSTLLNGTITHGIRISQLVTSDGQAVVGQGVTRSNVTPQPIALGRKRSAWHLYVQHGCCWDNEQQYLAVEKTTIALYRSEQMNDGDLLFSLDYSRQSSNQYPAAHLHVQGDRNDLALRGDRKTMKLRDLHFPVGGSRFRPTLEDVIEFTVNEGLAEPHDGWEDVIATHRARWNQIQAKATARTFRDDVADTLRELGWTVAPPS